MTVDPGAGSTPGGPPTVGQGAPVVPSQGPGKKSFASVLGDIKDILTNVYGIVTVAGALVASFVGGAAVGHVATPTTTVAGPAPVTPTPSVTASPSVTSSPSVTPSPSATVTPTPASGGTLLGSYTVKLPPGYSVPLGASAPQQTDFAQGSGPNLFSNGQNNYPGANSKMLQVAAGTTPTYQGCAADTEFIGLQSIFVGAAFCYVEPGRMLGITVGSIATTPAAYEVLNVTVWSNP